MWNRIELILCEPKEPPALFTITERTSIDSISSERSHPTGREGEGVMNNFVCFYRLSTLNIYVYLCICGS